jgi:hypothetical protein
MSIMTEADVLAVRTDRLMSAAASYFPTITLSDTYILGKLQVEEKQMERALRAYLEPVELLPSNWDPANAAALVAGGSRVVWEPGYDYYPGMLGGWEQPLILRQRGVNSVTSINFMFPSATMTLYEIPQEWWRIDYKYGIITFLPVVATLAVQMSGLLLSIVSAGQKIPQAIYVRYQAGMTDVRDDHPDVVDAIYRSAVCSIIEDQFTGGSWSTSADGLSQSFNIDTQKYRDRVAVVVERVRRSLQGVQLAVV